MLALSTSPTSMMVKMVNLFRSLVTALRQWFMTLLRSQPIQEPTSSLLPTKSIDSTELVESGMRTRNMNSEFERSLDIIFKEEGGLANLKNDPGKLTNMGVTQATYDAFRDKQTLPRQSVQYGTKEEFSVIYLNRFWMPGNCPEMDWPMSVAHFAACVNMGPEQAIKLLQRALDLDEDGVVGSQTVKAIEL